MKLYIFNWSVGRAYYSVQVKAESMKRVRQIIKEAVARWEQIENAKQMAREEYKGEMRMAIYHELNELLRIGELPVIINNEHHYDDLFDALGDEEDVADALKKAISIPTQGSDEYLIFTPFFCG